MAHHGQGIMDALSIASNTIGQGINALYAARDKHLGKPKGPFWDKVKELNKWLDTSSISPIKHLNDFDDAGTKIGENVGEKLNLAPGLGGLLIGSVIPGPQGELKALKGFKTDALTRSKKMTEAGYSMDSFPGVKTRTAALEQGYPARPTDKIWEGTKAELKAAGQKFLDEGGNRKDLKTVGVIPTTTNGRPDVLYNRKQGTLSIRGVAQEQNTKLNRDLNLVQQTDGPSTFKAPKSQRPNYGVPQNEHHINGPKQLDFIFEGASAGDSKALTEYATSIKKPIGDNRLNNADVPKVDVHDPLHNYQREMGFDPALKVDLRKVFKVDKIEDLTLDQRKLALSTYLDVIGGAQEEKLFSLMQDFNRKKLKPK
jgi:hypothetical protein